MGDINVHEEKSFISFQTWKTSWGKWGFFRTFYLKLKIQLSAVIYKTLPMLISFRFCISAVASKLVTQQKQHLFQWSVFCCCKLGRRLGFSYFFLYTSFQPLTSIKGTYIHFTLNAVSWLTFWLVFQIQSPEYIAEKGCQSVAVL